MKKTETYRRAIVTALKAAKLYNRALSLQVWSLASALQTLELANADIAALDSCTVWEETRYGKKLAPHPAFKIQRDAQDSVTRQLKALGLTAEGMPTDEAGDLLVELTEKVIRAGGNGGGGTLAAGTKKGGKSAATPAQEGGAHG